MKHRVYQAVAVQQIADALDGVAVIAKNQGTFRPNKAQQRKEFFKLFHRSRAHDFHRELRYGIAGFQKIYFHGIPGSGKFGQRMYGCGRGENPATQALSLIHI